MVSVQRLAQSVVFYPVTAVYVAGSVILALVVGGQMQFDVGLLLFTAVTGLVLIGATRREVTKVHHLVNSQRDLLLERIDQLVEALLAAGVRVPTDKAGVDRERKPG